MELLLIVEKPLSKYLLVDPFLAQVLLVRVCLLDEVFCCRYYDTRKVRLAYVPVRRLSTEYQSVQTDR